MIANIKSFYLIGIGGISMSAIAQMLVSKGYIVYGSDITNSKLIEELKDKNINIKIGNCPEFVKKSDALLLTGAISEDNNDVLLAKKLNKPIFSRAEVLGWLSNDYKVISIAGTHGKTTTTGMVSSILLSAGRDPTIHIGGILNNINSNLRLGKSDLFVTEACEYKDSFLHLNNFISVVLNVEEDHLDYFKNLDNIYKSFNKFIENTSEEGVVVYNNDELDSRLKIGKRKFLSFGFEDGAVVQARNIKEYKDGKFEFDVYILEQYVTTIKLPCFGKHNIKNALAAVCVAKFLGVENRFIKEGLEKYGGVKRRFELINEKDNHLIIHDYAHHPVEISATLEACREIKKNGKIIAIFQPHTFSRTKDLFIQFSKCFELCDEVWLLPIYPAREKPIKGINSRNLSKIIKKNGKKSKFFSNFSICRQEIIKQIENVDLFIILGAGDVEELAYSLKCQSLV